MFRSFAPRARFCLFSAANCALLAAWLAPAAQAQILETHADSLTSYLGGKSAVQNAKPRPEQRGANHDGSPRAGSTHSMAIAGNPFENAWRGETSVNGVALDTGVWSTSDVDLAFPANVPWRVGRSFNHRQTDGGSLYAADSAQGKNWFQSSMPELVLYDDADNAKDVLYLVFGADRYAEYKRTGSSSTEFKGVNGAAGRIKEHAGTPDTYELLDQRGWRFHFIGFDAAKNGAKGQLWKVVNPAGDTAFVGDASVAADAVTNGFDANGKLLYAFDSSDRRITYSWNSDSTPHISQVKVETKTGGTWSSPSGVVEVGRVDYTYYGNESFGDEGDLKTVKVTLPLTDSGVSDVRVKYYRYWEGAFNATTNPGHPHSLKLVLDDEGARRYDWADSTFDDDFLTETTDNLKPYAAAYLEYDSSQRVAAGWFNGKCGCSGAGSGTFEFRYESNGSYSDSSGYTTTWARRTSVERPDGTWLTQYFDELGQPLHHVITDGDPAGTSPAPSRWAESVTRDSSGRVSQVGAPSALDTASYSHSSGTVSLSSSAGLVWEFTRTGSGDLTGFLATVKFKTAGTGGSSYFDRAVTWTSATEAVASGGGDVVRPLVIADKHYQTAQTTQEISEERYSTVASTPVSSKVALAEVSTTAQAVASANNGANSSTDSSAQHLTTAGHVDFAKDRDGAITYREYTSGQVTKEVEDANTSSLSPPSGFAHAGTPLNLVTQHAYDAQGRRTTTTHPDGRVTQSYYSRLADRRRVTLEFPKYDSGSGKRYGPVRYAVTNHAGQVEASGVIALAGNESTSALTAYIDETDADAITAVDVGSVAQLRTSVLDASGTQVSEERAYFAIPTSLPGTDGAHYDATKFGYDELGRRRRVKEPHGTVTRTVYDARGNVTARWTGTVDSSFPGGEAGTDNMVKVEELTFDGGADGGNGHLTKRTLFVQDSATGKRETSYFHDARGRVIATVNPTAPHTVSSFDNLGRVTATAQYSSSSGLSASSVPTTTTNRLAYSQSFYDERGQMWKSVRHKINASTGASDDSLETLSWFDAAGRLKKRDGEQLEKFAYGRLGRQTHHFVLASVDTGEDTWAEAMDVVGDIVLEERQTAYDGEGEVLMEASIARFYSDAGTGETTGALDTNADGDALAYTAANVLGRIQITARWYDDFDRLVDVVQYGTNDATANVATFDRDGLSVPARADDKLRTTYEFNTDGTLKQTTDPKGLITRYEYDALGRQTAVIANYVDGAAGGGANGDEDQIVRYGYTDGLQTSITADLPSPETDQVTRYYFGTKKGTPAASKLASGHLLRAVKYPDSTNAAPEPTSSSGVDYIDATSDADVVGFAFNAQGQEIWRKDQVGGIIETTFDDAGRQTARAVTTLASGFDGAVRRIETAYDALGRTETVTQFDAASAGNVVDQVKNVFDGWGNLTNFRQDLDSTVGGSGYWDVAYTYAKATDGRNTVRRTGVTLPGGASYGFNYRGGASHDSEASRVSSVMDAFDTDLAAYEYIGVGQVVRTTLDEVGIFSKAYTGSGTTFGRLDRFNRTTISSWTRDLSTDRDLYKVTLGYDRNSNITSQDDAVHTGHDVAYANDGLNRLIDADEGTLSGGSIGSRTRRQQWTLNQTGNWNRDKVDLNGDGDFLDAGELDDTRTHNAVNELTARDTNTSSPAEFSFTYDAAGNMTDDGVYKYEWDAFYRLRKVKNQSNALVSEYWYNGLGYLVTRHQDTDTDGDVDGSDVKFHAAYDERWRQVATFRASDSSPKEQFVYHCAGNGGRGGSSYIDSVLLRDRDMTNGWTGAADGTLEERVYLLQNWRADVVAIVAPDGDGGATMLEWIKYSAYGVPFALPAGDTDSDGDCDSTDDAQITTWKNAPAYDVRGDLDLDGDVDATDESLVVSAHQSLGRGVLTSSAVGNCKGYAGYEGDAKLSAKWHVRHRVLDSVLGRWLRRDPLGYVDGKNLCLYVRGRPVELIDPLGRAAAAPLYLECGESRSLGAYDIDGTHGSYVFYSGYWDEGGEQQAIDQCTQRFRDIPASEFGVTCPECVFDTPYSDGRCEAWAAKTIISVSVANPLPGVATCSGRIRVRVGCTRCIGILPSAALTLRSIAAGGIVEK